jgi:hypothetical protein
MTDDEGDWFVGDLALAQLPPGELLRLRGRTANEKTMGNTFRLRLAKVAIGKVMQGMWNRDIVHIRIATGLPTEHTYRRTGVCDVGTYTVDLALDDEGEVVDAESGSVEEVLRTGIFHANGQPVDYHEIVEEARAPLGSATLNLMSEKWQRGATVNVVYLSDGGAELVVKDVPEAYPSFTD